MLAKVGLASIGVLLNLLIVSIPLLAHSDFTTSFANPTIWIFYILISIFCLTEIWSSNPEADQGAGTMPYLPHIAGFTLLALIWISVFETEGTARQAWFSIVLGAVLMLSGILLRAQSISTLNTQFLSQIRLHPDHSLTKSGIYAVIRHPSELGLLLIGLGIPTLLHSTTGLYIYLGFFVPLSLYRIWLEDNLLSNAFENEFSIYKSTTPALFPKLLHMR